MQPEVTSPVVDALCASLETMAFISPFPPDPGTPLDCPAEARRVTIQYTGPTAATLELIAPRALGAVLASNLLACDAADELALANADDILKELANVTCGGYLQAITDGDAAGYEMGIPQVSPLSPEDWAALLADGQHVMLDADGHLITAKVQELAESE